MGKTKIKTIDDSAPEEPKVRQPKKIVKRDKDSLIEKLNAELGVEKSTADTSVDGSEEKIATVRQDVEPRNDGKKKAQKPGKAKFRSKKYQNAAKDLDRSKTYSLTDAIDKVKSLSYSKFNGTLEIHINTAQIGVRGLVSLPFASGRKLRILAFGSTASKPDSSEEISDVEFKTETKAPVIHLRLGKLNQSTGELSQNVKTLITTIGKSRIKKVTLSPTMGPSVKLDYSSI